MVISLSADQVCFVRLRAQQLIRQSVPDTPDQIVSIVKGLCGIQAQDVAAATLALRAQS